MKWIPCNERLPEMGQKVLVSTKKTVFTQVFKGVYEEPKKWHWEHKSLKTIEAWMPLPQPYEAEQNDPRQIIACPLIEDEAEYWAEIYEGEQTEPKEECTRTDGDCENCWKHLHCRAKPKGESDD